NTPPVAVDDTASTTDQNPVVIDAAGNDTDADNDTLNVSAFNQPANGTVTQLVDGTLQYVADAGFSGDDTFGYTVSDGNGGTDTGTVTVTV
ncbi:MAG: cadherin-like domain-containing protein, partial [Hyphomonas sp.]|nr:cadherin-like domain-containing protein [Hyphomonas sp.]